MQYNTKAKARFPHSENCSALFKRKRLLDILILREREAKKERQREKQIDIERQRETEIDRN